MWNVEDQWNAAAVCQARPDSPRVSANTAKVKVAEERVPVTMTSASRTEDVELSIAQKIRLRDEGGLRLFDRVFRARIARILASQYGSALSEEDRCDIWNEVCLAVWESIHNWNPLEASFSAWVSGVVKHIGADHVKRRGRECFAPLLSDPVCPRSQASEREFNNERLIALVQHAIARLSPLERCIIRSDMGEPSGKASGVALAAELNTTPGVIYVARCRALARIKKYMIQRVPELQQVADGAAGNEQSMDERGEHAGDRRPDSRARGCAERVGGNHNSRDRTVAKVPSEHKRSLSWTLIANVVGEQP